MVRVLTQLPFAKDNLGGLSNNESFQLRLIGLLWKSLEEPEAIRNIFQGAEAQMHPEMIAMKEDPAFWNLSYLREAQLYAAIILHGLLGPFVQAWWRLFENTLFWTSDGTLGSASSFVGPGDVVALIPGVRAPMILCMTGPDTYQVLGPAYVDGLMEGGKWFDDRRSELGFNSPEVESYDDLT
jgi:hypothetical protein